MNSLGDMSTVTGAGTGLFPSLVSFLHPQLSPQWSSELQLERQSEAFLGP